MEESSRRFLLQERNGRILKMLMKFLAERYNSGLKATEPLPGTPLEGPGTPLPDKMLLVFILDRLQKKDTYGVFSDPVDHNELLDYHEVIEHPMDFGTVRKKLSSGAYASLEQFEELSSDSSQHVLSALALVIMGMAPVLGKDNASTLKAQFDQQKNVVENLVSNTQLLESKIQEAKSKKDTLKARAQSAKNHHL